MKLSALPKRFHLELAGIWVLAAITRLPQLSYPHSTVFDEVYFKQFTGAYFTHKYYFDIHPPLGKLLLAGWARLIGVNPATITAPPATGLRVLIALAGIAIAPLVYGIVRRLSGSRLAAVLAAVVVVLDGALIVESRFVLVDSLLLLFGLGAIYAALRYAAKPRWYWLAATGLLIGMAAGIKWTGLAPSLVAGLILVRAAFKQRPSWLRLTYTILIPILLAAAVYLSAFAVHFALLTKSGPGDAFMTTRFQATLIGNSNYQPSARLSFWAKAWELNHEMYEANRTLTATHPYGSKWYTWPLETRPIYYWEGIPQPDGTQGNIYLLGNPLTWWPASLAALAAILILAFKRRWLGAASSAIGLLTLGYLLNWLPFAGITRVMFLYHYLFAYLFSVMIMAILAVKVLPQKYRTYAVGTLAFLAVAGFVYFTPVTYGAPLSPAQLGQHLWLRSWR